MDRLARLIATFFGSGYFPIAPATFASAIVVLILYLLGPGDGTLAGVAGRGHPLIEGFVILALFPLSIATAHQAEKSLGHDASPIVIDEVLGQMIALWFVPRSWPWLLAGFLLFRLFDIWKPLLANEAQKLPGGWGIVLDDVLAGIYAAAILQAALWWQPLGR
jgi:phosphatidylglycerophosphatase A